MRIAGTAALLAVTTSTLLASAADAILAPMIDPAKREPIVIPSVIDIVVEPGAPVSGPK